ncbi:hypothetical protein JX265_000378 [Neoarthrinium moseri]|uniref:Carboxylic ester hydrolase n=1 Tax=Neoarthrinium moseri TaxID=1658444 RepID=A0A9Q0AW73_9PEZI|nr:uncharacterized protein JN550_000628 [Neoarthrinium moseri]KAI1851388.1 hypothetical protein JX266_003463 [Neoarthrinium moseri]KAI1878446.1 hypothetical protein JN550_000628 [Neoarthrinium moseri]KAI1881552.1 hypothetical protein JX265_000378 [Neoarthrinium moseri]
MKIAILFSSLACSVLAKPCKPVSSSSGSASASASASVSYSAATASYTTSSVASGTTSSASIISTSSSVLSSSSVSVSSSSTSSSARATPTVDLGYEIHQGTVNETGNYYTFSNVPYAQQPVGKLRFQKPLAPTGSSSEVNDGSTTGVMCIQAYPEWIIELQAAAYGLDTTTMAAVLYAQQGQTESCLLLDVYVPAEVFDSGRTAEAPVLIWIHGGGFTYGSKTSSGDPAGLVARSKLGGDSGAIVITINYRLGLFGWLAGPGATPNLGLLDQRMAMQWVQTYISKFGGNPNKVTVMGESAGAASILHHITSSQQPALFHNAIPQSPAFEFSIDHAAAFELTLSEAASKINAIIQESTAVASQVSSVLAGSTSDTFDFASLTSVFDALGDQVTETLKSINQAVVVQAGNGRFNYGPTVDGDYVPELPQVRLAQNGFDASVNVMPSHTSNESVPFVSSSIATDEDVRNYLTNAIKSASDETKNYMLEELYPAVFDGTYPWYSQYGRAVQMNTDLYFACSTNYLAKAYDNESHNYIFAYPPGYHANDVAYVFFNGDTSSLNNGFPINATLAYELQDYIVQFAKAGNPNTDSLPFFPTYGTEGKVLSFTDSGLVVTTDDMKNERCAWIQQAMIDGKLK